MSCRRALHFVLKVSHRPETIRFFKEILGMKVLRHEEFDEGCKASCNGPYDGKWSKTMVGYGPEENHFVIELTYNYGIGAYNLGNDFQNITIHNDEAYARIIGGSWPILCQEPESVKVEAPGGYAFWVYNVSTIGDPLKVVALSSTNLERSKTYWSKKLGMSIVSENNDEVLLRYSPNQCHLKFVLIKESINHAKAFGRVAFACPSNELPVLQANLEQQNETILTRLVSLDTPGKASVQVIILADPDGHEICFVGDEAFRQLSQVDPKADDMLLKAMEIDKSNEWWQDHIVKH